MVVGRELHEIRVGEAHVLTRVLDLIVDVALRIPHVVPKEAGD